MITDTPGRAMTRSMSTDSHSSASVTLCLLPPFHQLRIFGDTGACGTVKSREKAEQSNALISRMISKSRAHNFQPILHVFVNDERRVGGDGANLWVRYDTSP